MKSELRSQRQEGSDAIEESISMKLRRAYGGPWILLTPEMKTSRPQAMQGMQGMQPLIETIKVIPIPKFLVVMMLLEMLWR